MTKTQIIQRLEKTLSPKRFTHSMNVMRTAEELAAKYNEDIERASLAGLLHDCAREIRGSDVFEMCNRFDIAVDYVTRSQPELLHGPIGAFLAKEEYGVTDEGVLSAISSHTTGRENMSMLEKITFVADYIEPNRSFPGVDEARRTAFTDINGTLIAALSKTIKYVMVKGVLIHPDTVKARNYLINAYGKYPMNSLR